MKSALHVHWNHGTGCPQPVQKPIGNRSPNETLFCAQGDTAAIGLSGGVRTRARSVPIRVLTAHASRRITLRDEKI